MTSFQTRKMKSAALLKTFSAKMLSGHLLLLAVCCFSFGCSQSGQNTAKHEATTTVVFASAKGVPAGGIVAEPDVYEADVTLEKLSKADQYRPVLKSRFDAIGKVAKKGLVGGDFVYDDLLTLPSGPLKGEQWLFSYPNNILEKYVGKKVTLKGELFQANDKSFRVLSYDSAGRVKIIGNRSDQISANHCVLASGVLQRITAEKNAPLLKYGLDAKTVVLEPSEW